LRHEQKGQKAERTEVVVLKEVNGSDYGVVITQNSGRRSGKEGGFQTMQGRLKAREHEDKSEGENFLTQRKDLGGNRRQL